MTRRPFVAPLAPHTPHSPALRGHALYIQVVEILFRLVCEEHGSSEDEGRRHAEEHPPRLARYFTKGADAPSGAHEDVDLGEGEAHRLAKPQRGVEAAEVAADEAVADQAEAIFEEGAAPKATGDDIDTPADETPDVGEN